MQTESRLKVDTLNGPDGNSITPISYGSGCVLIFHIAGLSYADMETLGIARRWR